MCIFIWNCESSKRYHVANKGLYSQSYVFSSSHVWTWELDHKEGWTPKNWYFQTAVLEKTLQGPWIARRSNQSILKEINSEYSLEGLTLKLKLQYFGYLIWKTDSLEMTLMLGKIEDRGEGDDGRWDGWMASLTWWTWVWTSSGSWWWTEKPGVLQSMWSQSRTWLSDWTELIFRVMLFLWVYREIFAVVV